MDLLKVNQRLEVIITDKFNSERLSSRIEEIAEDYLVIAMPMSKGYPVMLARGNIFEAKVVTGGVAYQFTSRLLEKKLHPLPVWIISYPAEIKKIQQRAFVRVDAGIFVTIETIPEQDGDEVRTLSLRTKDVSGGGIRVIHKEPLKEGAKIKTTLHIADTGPVTAIGEVVRTERPDNTINVFWIGIKFAEISEKDRSKIIRFVFKKQCELRQKGL